MQQRRPQFFQDDNSDASHCQTGGDSDDGRDDQPFVQVARVGSRQIFRNPGQVLTQQRMLDESKVRLSIGMFSESAITVFPRVTFLG